MNRKIKSFLSFILASSFLLSCNNNTNSLINNYSVIKENKFGKVTLDLSIFINKSTFNIKNFDYSKIKYLNFKIEGLGINNYIEKRIEWNGNTSPNLTLDVPAGKNRIITVEALDSSSNVIRKVMAVTDVIAEQHINLSLNYGSSASARIMQLILNKAPLIANKVDSSKLNRVIEQLTGYNTSNNSFSNINPNLVDVFSISENIIANDGEVLENAILSFNNEVLGKVKVIVKDSLGNNINSKIKIKINDVSSHQIKDNGNPNTMMCLDSPCSPVPASGIVYADPGIWELKAEGVINSQGNFVIPINTNDEKNIILNGGNRLSAKTIISVRNNDILEVTLNLKEVKVKDIELYKDTEKINSSTIQIPINDTQDYTARVIFDDDSYVEDEVIWENSNSTIFSVNTNGVISGLKKGSATLTVKSITNRDVYKTFTIDVVEESLKPIILSFDDSNYNSQKIVEIIGKNFDDLVPSNNIVKFNGIKAEVLSASTEKLIVKVPEGPTKGYITVENSRGMDKSKSIFEHSNQNITSMVTVNIGDFLMGTPSLVQINKVIEIINDTSKVGANSNDTLNNLNDSHWTNISNYTGIKKDVLTFARDNSDGNKLLTKFLEELVVFTYNPYVDRVKVDNMIKNPSNPEQGINTGVNNNTTLNDFVNDNNMINNVSNYIKADANHIKILAKNYDQTKLLISFLKDLRDNQAVLTPSQSPMIKVFVSPFDIDKTEVTNKEYRKFIEAGGYDNPDFWTSAGWQWKTSNNINQPLYWNDSRFNQDNQPVVGVSWYEASAYAKWAGKRLPTEAEWEAVARFNNKSNNFTWGRLYPWGNSLPIEYDNNNSIISKRANGFFGQDGYDDDYKFLSQVDIFNLGKTTEGIADLAGNALEWVSDWYDISYYSRTSNFNNPIGPVQGNFKIARGGAWNNSSSEMRTYFREQYFRPESRSFNIGFRCVK
ncbi:MAG: hypothetical protein KatS3mg068_2248 [Candidatus Sericytochromatia bacterium]|nr:MAG: hypothetical protein KatS3mg068_2248 [Candidatus Sericytochromatia bacterium]